MTTRFYKMLHLNLLKTIYFEKYWDLSLILELPCYQKIEIIHILASLSYFVTGCMLKYFEQNDFARLCVSLGDGLDLVKSRSDIETCWIIGGSSIYQESMNMTECHRIYLTHIDQDFKCDVFFPSIGESYRQLDENESGVTSQLQTENDVTYHYKVFEKK